MANQYLYDLTDTWDNVATTFDAIKINVTDTNSAAGSKLLNLQVGASPKFTVQKDGAVALTGAVTGATSITGSGTFTADRLTVTKTTANAPAISSTGYSLTGSDATSLVDLAGTWNTTGNPTAIKLNVTNTASGTSSLLMDLQVGGSSLVSVTKDGQVRLPLGSSATPSLRFGTTEGMYIKDGSFVFQPNNNGTGGIAISQSTIFLPPSFTIGWQPSAGNPTQAPDTVIVRDGAANTLAQRNAGNAQTFNIYNTYSSSTSYERLSIIAQSNAAVRIVTNKGSGGGAAQALELGTDGTTRLTISATANTITLPSDGYIKSSTRNSGLIFLDGHVALRGTDAVCLSAYASIVTLGSGIPLGWSPNSSTQQTADLLLVRDAANTLAQRNATSAQTFNIYNTFSSATNYERLSIEAQSGAAVRIRTNKGSGGGSAQALELGTNATTALTLTTAQKAEFAATIKTAAPTGGTAAEWKLGTVASVTPTSPDRTIEVEIGGTIYYVHAKTTND